MANPLRSASRMPGCLLRSAGAAVSAVVVALLLTQVAFGALLLHLGPFASPAPPPSSRPSERATVAPASFRARVVSADSTAE